MHSILKAEEANIVICILIIAMSTAQNISIFFNPCKNEL